MKKQLIAVVLGTTMMLQGMGVWAQSPVQTKARQEITSMGIITGDESGAYRWDDPLTRAEFAAVMVRLCHYEDLIKTFQGESSFTDVDDDAWYTPYVNTVVKTRLMNGMGNGLFCPEEHVSFEQAVKTIMVCLGYDGFAAENGGYPDGYLKAAAASGLLYYADAGEPFTRGKLAQLLYNALDINIIQRDGNGVYDLQGGKTLREILMGDGETDGDKFQETGIVNANYYTYLNGENPAIEPDQLQIGGELYRVQGIDIDVYLGQEVDVYGQIENGDKVVTAIQPTKNNQMIKTDAKEIGQITADSMVFWENEKRRTVSFDHDIKMIYNGSLCSELTQDMLNLHDGSVQLVDHNNDNRYDVIMIRDYLHLRVEQVTEKGIRLAGNHRYQNSNFIPVDLEDINKKYRIMDGDGEDMTLDQIQKDDIVSICADQYGINYSIIVSSNRIEGMIDAVHDDQITVDGKKYDDVITDRALLKAGNQVTVYFAFNGKAVDLTPVQTRQNYGYIMYSTYTDEEKYLVKMIIPGVLKEREEDSEEETDDPNAAKIAVLSAKNKALETFYLKDKINVEGKNMEAEKALREISGKLIRYETDADGNIRKVTYPEKIGTGVKKVYNTYERTFGKTSGGAFGVTESTQVICIPKDNGQEISNDDYLVNVQMNNGQTYEVEGFDWNPDTKRADIIVLQASMNAQTGANITRRDPIGMVVEKADAVSQDGEVVSVFTILAEGEQLEYSLAEGIPNAADLEGIQKGDLVQYSIDGDGHLEGMHLIQSFSGDIINDWTDQYGENEHYTGYIVNVEPNIVSERLNKFAYQLDVSMNGPDGGVDTTFYVVENGTPPIFIYEPGQDRVTMGTIDDLCGGYSRVFVDSASMSVKAVVLIDE